jgi:transketolase
MRTAFISQLIEEAKKNENIFLVVGDLGYSVVEPFAELFPDRFLNAGIAEQNMTGVAAGLAMEGYNVFTYSIGNFPTLRCMEQIRYDVCYHKLSVKIVAVGAGYAYGPLGTSHHTTEDIGMLRTIPGINICSPSDPVEAKHITGWLCNSDSPAYLRLGKAGEKILHDSEISIENTNMICMKEGQETAILATGCVLGRAKNHIENVKNGWGLYSVPFIKPLDLNTLAAIANRYQYIITLEEHQMSSGFGSAILEGLNDLREKNIISDFPHVRRIAIKDSFIACAGTQEYLRDLMGLNI